MSVITVEHLSKRYGDVAAVRDVSFEVAEGEIFGLLGPNGAGKTTTVECIQGLRTPDGGRISVLGMDPISESSSVRRRIGAQLQESSLPDRIRVREALELFASFGDGSADWRVAMEEWGLTAKADSSFAGLSGGQRQRLLVALALLNRPAIVFLDEMTTGLDPSARRSTWSLIERIRSEGTTVVLVTHFMDEAERLCDRLAVVDGGAVIAAGTPTQLVTERVAGVKVRFSASAFDVAWLDAVAGVSNIERHGDVVIVEGEPAIAASVGAAVVSHGLSPSDFAVERPTLEDVYLDLIGGNGT